MYQVKDEFNLLDDLPHSTAVMIAKNLRPVSTLDLNLDHSIGKVRKVLVSTITECLELPEEQRDLLQGRGFFKLLWDCVSGCNYLFELPNRDIEAFALEVTNEITCRMPCKRGDIHRLQCLFDLLSMREKC